jgi:hypothetical protein
MAETFTRLQDQHIEFIGQQRLFFVGTAGPEGHVNVSPKGLDSFRVLDPGAVAWLNLTGSGNETAAHVLESGRMTVMFCSFAQKPLILRLYGTAQVVHQRDAQWSDVAGLFPEYTGARQVFLLDLQLVVTSCGYGVPEYTIKRERPTLVNWADKRGAEGVQQYWREKNVKSLDDRDTGIFE